MENILRTTMTNRSNGESIHITLYKMHSYFVFIKDPKGGTEEKKSFTTQIAAEEFFYRTIGKYYYIGGFR